jgi:thiol-disulfide isomerase/thioredoxin
MIKIMFMAIMLAAGSLQAQAQSDFEIVKSDNKEEVIYKGACTFEDIAGVKAFDLARKSEKYKPDAAATGALRSKLVDYQMVIFLGTWCEDSHKLIPELYRVLQSANYPLDELQLYALDRDKKGKNGEELPYHITNVPTIILLKDNKEIGRITEIVEKSIESDLLKIVEKTE